MSLRETFQGEAAVGARRQRDFDDLNHAVAGRDVGRQRKHIQDGDVDPVTGKKRRTASERAYATLQWLLLNDAEYARLHQAAMDSLRDAEDKARKLLERIEDQLAIARSDLADILDRAAALPDGTKVFRDGNGVVRDKDGARIGDDLAASIEWRGGEPSYEDYQSAADRVRDLDNAANEARGIETELGGYRGELTSENSPASKERIETITERIADIDSDMANKMADLDQLDVAPAETPLTISQDSLSSVPVIPIGQKR